MSRKKQNEVKMSEIFRDDALPAVGGGPSLVVTEGRVFATPEERAAMERAAAEKYITPQTIEAMDQFRSLMKRAPRVRAPPPATLVPYPTLAPDTDIVNKLNHGVMTVYNHGYETGKAEVDEIMQQRDQYLLERNTAVQELDQLNQRVMALEYALKRFSLVQDGPPPPRADASHGAAGAAGPPPGSLDGL